MQGAQSLHVQVDCRVAAQHRGGVFHEAAEVVDLAQRARPSRPSARRQRVRFWGWFGAIGVGASIALAWLATWRLSRAAFDTVLPVQSLSFTGPAADALMLVLSPPSSPLKFDLDLGLVPGVFAGAFLSALSSCGIARTGCGAASSGQPRGRNARSRSRWAWRMQFAQAGRRRIERPQSGPGRPRLQSSPSFTTPRRIEVTRTARRLAMAFGLSLITTWTAAQPGGPGPGPGGPGPGPAKASAGPGPGPAGGRWGPRYTPGWSLMTEAERNEHRERMRSMKTHQECETYHQQHREKLAERAKERGVAAPQAQRRDPCQGLPR